MLHRAHRLATLPLVVTVVTLLTATRVLAQFTGHGLWVVPEGVTTAEYPLKVGSPSSGLMISLALDSSDPVTLSLVLPNQQVLDENAIVAAGGACLDLSAQTGEPESTDGAVAMIMALVIPDRGRIVTITLPGPLPPGMYTLRATLPQPLEEERGILVSWDMNEEIATSVAVDPIVSVIGKPMLLAAGVMRGQAPVTGATVAVMWRAATGATGSVSLLDSGASHDGDANDGVYAGGFMPAEAGAYDFAFTITGTADGFPYEHRHLAQAYVGNASGWIDASGSTWIGTIIFGIEEPRPYVARKVLNAAGKVVRVELDVPVAIAVAGAYTARATLTSPVSQTTYRAVTTQELAPGERVITLSIDADKLILSEENGLYVWSQVTLDGPLMGGVWELDRDDELPGGAQSEVLINEADWNHPPVMLTSVSWHTTDANEDGFWETLVATVHVRANYAGTYLASCFLYAKCNVDIGAAYDTRALDGNGVPEQFVFTWQACDVNRYGIDGPYELRNLRVQWHDRHEPAPFAGLALRERRVFPSPAYDAEQFACAIPPSWDWNNNDIPDRCEIWNGVLTDTNANGIPDESEPPPCPPACNLADITGIGGGACPDGQLTLDDIMAFVDAYNGSEGCPGAPGGPCNIADITGLGGPPEPPDGELTLEDIMAFVDAYNAGCPGAEG